MIIAVTGHRPDKLGKEYDMKGRFSTKIYKKLVSIVETNKPHLMISGMALGVDMIWANVAINKHIPFIAAVPCYNQHSRWPEKSQRIYARIINDPLCCLKYVTEKEYTPSCMQIRNKWMVDNSDVLVAIWDGSIGGTANCVKYAESVGRYVMKINPKEL